MRTCSKLEGFKSNIENYELLANIHKAILEKKPPILDLFFFWKGVGGCIEII